MLTNFNIKQIIEAVLNKDSNGNAFNQTNLENMINTQSLQLFRHKLEVVGLTKKADQDLWCFFKAVNKVAVSGIIDLTAENPAYIISFIPDPHTARGFDEVTAGELSDRLLNPITEPTLSDPVSCRYEQYKYEVYPSGILGARVSYYKYPRLAVVRWTRNATTLAPEYDAGNSVELEWDDLNKIEICYMILRDAGLNIERRDVTQVADNIIKSGK